MPVFESHDLRTYYELEGPESAPVLVLSNSLGCDLAMWQPQADRFRQHFRLLRYDTRGHGQSSATLSPYTIAQLSGDLLALLDHLQIGEACFCGLSMGGLIGMWLGANAPGRFRKLVLCNTAAKIGTQEGWDTRMVAVRNNGLRPLVPAALARWFTPEFRAQHPEIMEATGSMLEHTDPEGYAGCCAAIRDANMRGLLTRVRTPTLVVSGKHDPVTTPADGQELANRISGARYAELEAAHLSNCEVSKAFTRVVLEFLCDSVANRKEVKNGRSRAL